MKVDRRVCTHEGGVLNIWIRIGDRGPEGEGEGGQKQRTKKKKKGLHIIVTFILLIIKIIQLIFKNDVNKMGLPRKKRWWNGIIRD